MRVIVLHLLIRTLFTYFMVLLSLRLMGKREIGKLSIFDLVVSIIIAEVSAMALQDLRVPIWHGALIIFFLVAFQIGMSFLSMRNRKIHDLIEGRPTVLVANGEINDREMRRTRYNMNDLLMQLREKNIANVADVEFAILETSGKLSVFEKAEKMPATAQDLRLRVAKTEMPISLIVDGHLDHSKLAQIGKSKQWLIKELKAHGIQKQENVFYAAWDGAKLHVDCMDDPQKPRDETLL
ncbi:hypothetical protein AYW79_12230 [Ferroacidibacillus organovorans]|uniref:DUF421 domain-containing protein n=1 Tax=Ferroacidibacillus organovorans TaxID=1765683 RepID=A0A162TDG4_9BACL|nr:hypothetical protein AYJ22_10375 [Ferroacidibacillus organovorans]OAG93149.1 hypothetical protein AYW79_12230 [Ferroacidibacillus organovorans]OPG15934.1 DUF421 domain-containing protein [Ferroacidibacillus organovorans]